MGRILMSAKNWSCFTKYMTHCNKKKKLKEKKKKKTKGKINYAGKTSKA